MNKSDYNFFIAMYGGLSVGALAYSVMLLAEIYKNGASSAKLMALLLSVEAAIYTGYRAKSVWRDKNNQK